VVGVVVVWGLTGREESARGGGKKASSSSLWSGRSWLVVDVLVMVAVRCRRRLHATEKCLVNTSQVRFVKPRLGWRNSSNFHRVTETYPGLGVDSGRSSLPVPSHRGPEVPSCCDGELHGNCFNFYVSFPCSRNDNWDRRPRDYDLKTIHHFLIGIRRYEAGDTHSVISMHVSGLVLQA
jgi:hypothetical protein